VGGVGGGGGGGGATGGKRGNERGSRAGQSDRKGVGRSRGQGETVSHRPAESGELSGSLYALSFSCGRMHLGAAAEADCGRRTGQEREREKGRDREGRRKATLAAGAQPVTACVSGGTAPAMDVELPALTVVHAIRRSSLKKRDERERARTRRPR